MTARAPVLLALLSLSFAACTERGQEAAEANAEQTAARLDAASEQFRSEAEQAAGEIDRRIQALEQAAGNASGEARERYNETLNELRQERTALQADLDRFATISQDDFEDLREDVAEKQADLEADLDEASLELAETRAEFEAAARRRLDALDRDIARLQSDADAATGAAGEDADRALADLREQRRALGERLDGLGDATEDTFRGLRGDLAEGFADLRRGLARATEALATAATPGS